MAEGDSTQQSQLVNNFLYLHPNENPAAPLVSPVLDSSNYHSWSRSVVAMLSAKNKVEFILGSHPCPAKNDQRIRLGKGVTTWLSLG